VLEQTEEPLEYIEFCFDPWDPTDSLLPKVRKDCREGSCLCPIALKEEAEEEIRGLKEEEEEELRGLNEEAEGVGLDP